MNFFHSFILHDKARTPTSVPGLTYSTPGVSALPFSFAIHERCLLPDVARFRLANLRTPLHMDVYENA